MVIRQFHTPEGVVTAELTQEQVEVGAAMGDFQCKQELAKQELGKATTDTEKLAVVLKLLDLI